MYEFKVKVVQLLAICAGVNPYASYIRHQKPTKKGPVTGINITKLHSTNYSIRLCWDQDSSREEAISGGGFHPIA